MCTQKITPTGMRCTEGWRDNLTTTTTRGSIRSWTTPHRQRYFVAKQERDESKRGDAVATLRPRPYGPPLRGRAALRNGIRNRWPQGHHNTELGHGRFHLKKADPWSKNGGRRTQVVDVLEIIQRHHQSCAYPGAPQLRMPGLFQCRFKRFPIHPSGHFYHRVLCGSPCMKARFGIARLDIPL